MEKVRQILATWTKHCLADDESRLLVLMTVFQSQCPSLVQEVDNIIVDEKGWLDLNTSNVTAIECKAIAFCLTHTKAKLKEFL